MRTWNKCLSIGIHNFTKRLCPSDSRTSSILLLSTLSARQAITRFGLIQENAERLWPIYKNGRFHSSLSHQDEDTIYALSTAPGRAAIAIIRISGPSALNVYQALCPSKPAPKPRYASLRTLYHPKSSQDDDKVLDTGALVLYFPAPETATGEDVLELHVHGGTAVVKAVLAAIPNSLPISKGQTAPIRYAEPGEFTRRAFYNNRLDLNQIEALGDTLSAETEQQRRLAVRGSSSTLAARYEAWRQKLLYARGELEALIDFSEDQQFDESPAELCNSVAGQIEELIGQLKANIKNASRGELLRNGINIALVGAPNAGKSSLLNCIVGREAAIVSKKAGTTRDVVDVSVDIGGYLCRIGDLAGLRDVGDSEEKPVGEIEKEGIRRARERALAADVVIVIISRLGDLGVAEVEPEVSNLLRQLDPESQNVVCVLNKTDVLGYTRNSREKPCHDLSRHPSLKPLLKSSNMPVYPISCKEAQSAPTSNRSDPGFIQAFLKGLTQLFGTMTSAMVPEGQGNNAAWTESLGVTERQRASLEQCLLHLDSFLVQVRPAVESVNDGKEIDIVLAAESLRAAADCLARVTGRGEAGDVEEVLGVVFEKFCVGK